MVYGLDVAVQNISLGAIVEVTNPSLYAYGSQGHPPLVPKRATLVFRLELLEIEQRNGNIVIKRQRSRDP